MKSYLLLLLSFGLLPTSCCTKKYCIIPDYLTIEVAGLTRPDTVTVYSYERNSNYTKLLDSFSTRVQLAQYNGTRFALPKQMSYKNDLLILLGDSAVHYEVENLILERRPCNSCFPNIHADEYVSLASYVLNGKRVEKAFISIQK